MTWCPVTWCQVTWCPAMSSRPRTPLTTTGPGPPRRCERRPGSVTRRRSVPMSPSKPRLTRHQRKSPSRTLDAASRRRSRPRNHGGACWLPAAACSACSIILKIAAGALSALKLAALWVLIPPSIMLIGYVLLLREASHADAERAQREEEAERAWSGRRNAPASRPPSGLPLGSFLVLPFSSRSLFRPSPWPSSPRHPARAATRTRAATSRPGLAGKYTTSHTWSPPAAPASDEDYRDDSTRQLR